MISGGRCKKCAAAFSIIIVICCSILYYVKNNAQKPVEVAASSDMYVYPMGTPVGIYLETDGIMIVGTGKVTDIDGNMQDPAGELVQSGDYIVAVNGNSIEAKEDFARLVGENEELPVSLTIRRNNEMKEVQITPVCSGEEEYRLGIWIRDDTQGIGTMTYVTEDGHFGALGHGISDLDTGDLVESECGCLYEAELYSVIKGTGKNPGSLCGSIHYDDANKIGIIEGNSSKGIYGSYTGNMPDGMGVEAIPVGSMYEVKEGPAVIRCTIEDEVKEYDIEILKIERGSKNHKDMVIKVTDPDLLEMSGGIVQGMSGSPIVQNGKLVGAVTHVLVNDPTRGYGIFIENMLEAAK